MTPEAFAALVVFALVGTGSPGPNNIMLMASGANFGLRRSLPHMLGIALGFSLMIVLVGVGVARLFALWPPSGVLLKAASAAYLLFLAWKIATAAPSGRDAAAGRPLSFLQAAAFQWVNPKAWAISLSAIGAYAPGSAFAVVLAVSAIFLLVGLPCLMVWTLLGQQMRRVLDDPRRLRLFNWLMAGLLVLSLASVLL